MRALVNRSGESLGKLRHLGDMSELRLSRSRGLRALNHLMRGVCMVTLATLSSCGGGTTGTSSSDSLRFSGFAQDADGARAARLSMSVTSTATNENLVDSGTNDSGDFSMELPAEEQSFLVDVDGVGTTTISRQQRGVGTMASKLSVTSSGALVAEDVFETQVLASPLCQSLTLNGSSIVVSGDVGQAPCEATFAVASNSLPLTSFSGRVEATCAGSRAFVTSANSSSEGQITLDLNAAFRRGCSDIEVVVSSRLAPELQSAFQVL